MTIKEVEERTGLARSNIRFYEKEKLIAPARNGGNGYRDYSEKDVEDIKKIAYLRTLGISVDEIGRIISGEKALYEVLRKQKEILDGQIADLSNAKSMCERMLCAEDISYEKLQVELYVDGLQDYWGRNRSVFHLDSVGFMYRWGSFAVWAVITLLCLAIGILSYGKLPPEIPVQWSKKEAVSFVDKNFIFAYFAACIVIRYVLRPLVYAKIRMDNHYGGLITEYLANYMCFIALSVEAFSVLFVFGLAQNVVLVLAVDTLVLVGMLALGIIRLDLGSA